MAIIASLLLQAAAPLPPDYEKRRQLSEAVLGKRPATEGEVQALLEKAMKDPDPVMRREAVGIIGTIRMIASMPQTPPGQEWAVRLQGVAQALAPAAEAALEDEDGGVRREALRAALASHAFTWERAPLPLATVEMLAAKFNKDPSPEVRSFVVQAFRPVFKSDDPRVTAIGLRIARQALQDADPYVVQYAGWLAFESKAPELLPLLVTQLKNPSHVARMGVAAGLQGYSVSAKPYLPQLEEALAREPEGPAKKTLEAAIRLIRESR